MERVTAQKRIVLPDLQLFRLHLFVAGGGVARGGLALLPRLGAFNGDNFAGHNRSLSQRLRRGDLKAGHTAGIIPFPWPAFLPPLLPLRSRRPRRCRPCPRRPGVSGATLPPAPT